MPYQVIYMPTIDKEFIEEIKKEITPSMTSDDTNLYNVDYIMENIKWYADDKKRIKEYDYVEL